MLSGAELGKVAYDTWGRFGVPVFPCNDEKKPLCKWRDDASCDEEQIVALFASRGAKARAIGAAMGGETGLFAVDFDLYKGPDARNYMQTLLLAGLLPETRVHETQSGGLHYLYFVPDGTKTPRNSVPHKGVEIRGEGGYIVVPPSRGYKVTSDRTCEAPLGLIKRIERADAAFRSLSVSGLVEQVINGDSFHEALVLIAAKMHSRGESNSNVMKTLNDAMMGSVAANPMHERHGRWAKIMNGKDGELARLSTSAFRKYNPARDQLDVDQVSSSVKTSISNRSVTLGGFFSPKPADAANFEPHGASAIPDTVPVADKGSNTVSLDDITDFPFPRSYSASKVNLQDNKTFLIYPLIMEGDVVVLSAEPKAGKTLIGTNLCLHAAAGIPIGDELTPMAKDGTTAKISIIYFALEGQGAVRKRIRAWLENNKHPDGTKLTEKDLHLYVVEMPINLSSDEAKQDIVDRLLRSDAYFKNIGWGPLGLVVFDTLTKAMPGKDQNSVEDTSAVFQTVDMMREVNLECAVMFIHHNNKNSKSPRGSSNILAEPDTILLVNKIDPVMVDDVQRRCHSLSVYMARAIDDSQIYRFSAKEVEIGLNSQGLLEKAPALEIIADYAAAPRKDDVVLRKAASNAKDTFYEILWTSLSGSNDMFQTFIQLRRALERSSSALAFFNSYLNDNSKQGAMAAWRVLVDSNRVPESLEGMAFTVTEHGVQMALTDAAEGSVAVV